MVIDVAKLRKQVESIAAEVTLLGSAAKIQELKPVVDLCEDVVDKLIESASSLERILDSTQGLVITKEKKLASDNKTMWAETRLLFDKPLAVDNGDGTASFKGKLVGMGL